jgi:hypothetical protein
MEIRHNGALVMRGEDHEVEAWKKGHPDMEGITVEPNRPFELHADGALTGSFIDSFGTLEEARGAHEQFEARFPKAEVRTADGEVAHPLSAASAPTEIPASEAPTDPAPPEA